MIVCSHPQGTLPLEHTKLYNHMAKRTDVK